MSRAAWSAAAAVFVVAVACRLSVPYRPHDEGDELIYQALVEQLDAGRGYTLQGHEILRSDWIDREQYGQRLFYHPPGGVALLWGFHRLAGPDGPMLAELASFAVFFWSVILIASIVVEPFGVVEGALAGVLAGFSPIVLHVTARVWLDGPLVAFSTLAAAFGLLAVVRGGAGWALLAGTTLGYASLVKPTAFLVVPGLVMLQVAVAKNRGVGISAVQASAFAGAAIAAYAVWLVWRWSVLGSPFPGWAGRPTASLAATNAYVRYVTVVRRPWVYLRLLPEVLATIVPALVLSIARWRRVELRRTSLAWIAWIGTVVLVHVALGFAGFSKVLRYVVLVSPATIVLFVLQAGAAWRDARAGRTLPWGAAATWGTLALAAAGLVVETVQGISTLVVDRDLIVPWLTGL